MSSIYQLNFILCLVLHYLLFQAFKNNLTTSSDFNEFDENQDLDLHVIDSVTDIDVNDETEEIILVDIFNALQTERDQNEDEIQLPKHYRCSAHIMNLLGMYSCIK